MKARVLLAVLACAGCGGSDGQGRSPAAAERETDCDRAIAVLLADRSNGKTCEEGKAHAALAEPGCPLVFTCKTPKDGGR